MNFNIIPLKPFPLVVLLSADPLLSFLPQIQNALPGSPDYVIIDMLFIAGNSSNRFKLIPFYNRKLMLSLSSQYSPPKSVLEASERVFFQNFSLLSNSIATDEFKKFIQKKGGAR